MKKNRRSAPFDTEDCAGLRYSVRMLTRFRKMRRNSRQATPAESISAMGNVSHTV
ncbi:hypothetical protein [Ruminococcus callidus]|uniref:hypothetical protein n=1 Tax=Ruminococcus callidus TaxID=40519 RepID=UPI0039EDFF72